MSRLYIFLLAVAGFSISSVGATFSVVGLAQLFSGAHTSVIVMASVLEFAKVVIAGFVYRYWGHINKIMRTYLSAAIVVLVCITSAGIYGYLSNAYQQSSFNLRNSELKLKLLGEENQTVLKEIEDSQRFIDEIPRSRISKKFEMQSQYEPRIRKLRKRSELLTNEMSDLRLENLKTQTKIGPIIYVAQAFGVEVDRVVRILILVFVSVFDPLAICIVFAMSLAIRLREKYKGNENRIAAHALSTPVDHRFKKSA